MMLRSRILSIAFLASFLFSVCLVSSSTTVFAQEKSSPQSPASGVADARAQEAQPASNEASQKTGESKHDEESSEEAELRHSAAVRFVARITGLTDNQAYWVCVLINFAIVLFAVVYALRKKLPGFFRGRTDAIQKHLEEARRTSEDARRRLKEVEARLGRLDEEIGAMRRDADQNARAEQARVQSEVEEERRRIVASAEQEIAMAAAAARRELQGYAAELAVDLAEKKIHVGSETDQALVKDFTSWLGKDGN